MMPNFVAEVSSNHFRDIDRCLRFIDIAASIGCGAVKFQLFKLEDLFAPEILAKSEKIRRRKNWELPSLESVSQAKDYRLLVRSLAQDPTLMLAYYCLRQAPFL